MLVSLTKKNKSLWRRVFLFDDDEINTNMREMPIDLIINFQNAVIQNQSEERSEQNFIGRYLSTKCFELTH